MVSMELMCMARSWMRVAWEVTMATEIAAEWCAWKVRGEVRAVPYTVESCVVGRRDCALSARRARSMPWQKAPVVSVVARTTVLPRRCASA